MSEPGNRENICEFPEEVWAVRSCMNGINIYEMQIGLDKPICI